ncbi:MAG: hypothetical protein ACI845_003925, partial [Gammaproteobacteria bacterium]
MRWHYRFIFPVKIGNKLYQCSFNATGLGGDSQQVIESGLLW